MLVKIYLRTISAGKCLNGTRMYSGLAIGDAKKKSFTSAEKKVAPCSQSEMVLLSKSFVSTREAAGDPSSYSYDNRSPPTTILTLYG